MQIETEKDGVRYVYKESFWLGKRELSVNGMQLQKLDRRTFSWQDEGGVRHTLKVKGSFLAGITLQYENGNELVVFKNKWYEWLLIFLPFLGIVFGVGFCGGIGGGLSALFCILGGVVNAILLREGNLPLALRIVLCLVVTALVQVAWFFLYSLIATAILNALA